MEQLNRLESSFGSAYFEEVVRGIPAGAVPDAMAAAIPDVFVAFRQVVFEAVLLQDFDQRDVTSYLYSIQDKIMGLYTGPLMDSILQLARDGFQEGMEIVKDYVSGKSADTLDQMKSKLRDQEAATRALVADALKDDLYFPPMIYS
jgi:hypothetical protein